MRNAYLKIYNYSMITKIWEFESPDWGMYLRDLLVNIDSDSIHARGTSDVRPNQ